MLLAATATEKGLEIGRYAVAVMDPEKPFSVIAKIVADEGAEPLIGRAALVMGKKPVPLPVDDATAGKYECGKLRGVSGAVYPSNAKLQPWPFCRADRWFLTGVSWVVLSLL